MLQQQAVIYCRVSSPAQVRRGHGLESQEIRCRDYAKRQGYDVVNVFHDEGISGGLIERQGMQAMLAFLEDNRTDKCIVIIDDISRLARDIKAHLDLRAAINDAGGKLESPSIEFGEDSDSILIENLLASVSQHQRQKNAEQVKNRMKARVHNGYWLFSPVMGYKYENVQGHGKMLVKDEPNASIIKEALEGFASGRFESCAEIQRFLNKHPSIPRLKTGEVDLNAAIALTERPIYAGYITVKKWKLFMHPAKHEPIIDLATWQKIQERKNNKGKIPARTDLNEDFPLRGFINCGTCEHPMTAAWSKGRNTYYPYYFCQLKTCAEYKKSIRRDDIELGFEDILKELQPSPKLFHLVYEMFSDLWKEQKSNLSGHVANAKTEAKKIEAKIGQLMDRIIGTDNDTLITAYEEQIKKLSEKKLYLQENSYKSTKTPMSFEQSFRTAFSFLSNPWRLWDSDLLKHKRMVAKLAFPDGLFYSRQTGYRTAAIALPFRAFGVFSTGRFKVVGPEGLEPPTRPL
ncbi:recombinase family protein [Kordiimonas laminariae]|uniref:recombinase family protein n=1 Tax=Kordiimonas laminariae TaxID=2917717 RepID=UPI0031BBB89D